MKTLFGIIIIIYICIDFHIYQKLYKLIYLKKYYIKLSIMWFISY